MKATDLSVFYQLGANLSYFLDHVNIGDPAGELYTGLQIPLKWLVAFRSETFELADTLKETCEVVEHFITALHGLMDSIPKDWDRPVVQGEVQGLHYWKGLLDEAFQREQRNLDVFAVTPKGLYNTRYLIEHPEKQFPDRLQSVLPTQMLYDRASRKMSRVRYSYCLRVSCLPGYRIADTCLLQTSFGARVGLQKKKDSKIYIEQLSVEHAPEKITTRLDEVRDLDRNAYIHADTNVSLEEAQVLFELCKGVNFYMAGEMVKMIASYDRSRISKPVTPAFDRDGVP
jgi:hypothetical protein